MVGLERLRQNALTSPLTVATELRKRRSAQRWAATYSHGGVLLHLDVSREVRLGSGSADLVRVDSMSVWCGAR